MVTICPITNEKCPYNIALNNGTCEDQLTCPIVDTSFKKIKNRKKRSNKKNIKKLFLFISIFLFIAAIAYLLFFTDLLTFEKKLSIPSLTPPIASPKSSTGDVVLVNNQVPLNTKPSLSTKLEEIKTTENPPIEPKRIQIDSISIYAEIRQVSLNKYNLIETFPSKDIVSWFKDSYLPGEIGNCILSGNKYYNNFTAIFNNLDEIKIGDKIIFTLDNGIKITQEVYDIKIIEGNILPKSFLEADSGFPITTIISQTGDIIKETGNYENLIVILAH